MFSTAQAGDGFPPTATRDDSGPRGINSCAGKKQFSENKKRRKVPSFQTSFSSVAVIGGKTTTSARGFPALRDAVANFQPTLPKNCHHSF